MKTLHCIAWLKIENATEIQRYNVLQKRYILIVVILQVANLISDVKNVKHDTIKCSRKTFYWLFILGEPARLGWLAHQGEMI